MTIDQIGSFMAIVLIFALVLYGSYFVSKKVAKLSMREQQSRYMKLEDRMMLGQDRCVSIVSIGAKYYLIGSTANQVNILAELQEEDLTEIKGSERSLPGGLDFKQVLSRLGKDKEQ